MRCEECGRRLDDHPFRYGDVPFCCECMSVLCSWFLDGGCVEEPEMFAELGVHPPKEFSA